MVTNCMFSNVQQMPGNAEVFKPLSKRTELQCFPCVSELPVKQRYCGNTDVHLSTYINISLISKHLFCAGLLLPSLLQDLGTFQKSMHWHY